VTASDPRHFMLTLGNSILGDGFSSRLYRDLRVKTGYVYSVSSRLSWKRQRASYEISFGADAKNIGPARDLAVRDIEAMQKAPVSDDELNRAKASLLRQIPMERASYDLIGLEDLQLVDLGLPLDHSQLAARHYYAATPADVQAAFRDFLRPGDLAQIVQGPPAGG